MLCCIVIVNVHALDDAVLDFFRPRTSPAAETPSRAQALRRDGVTVRLFTRRGYDWTDRYRAIANAAAKLKAEIIERRRRNFRSRRGWP
jgi:hypothetical protein